MKKIPTFILLLSISLSLIAETDLICSGGKQFVHGIDKPLIYTEPQYKFIGEFEPFKVSFSENAMTVPIDYSCQMFIHKLYPPSFKTTAKEITMNQFAENNLCFHSYNLDRVLGTLNFTFTSKKEPSIVVYSLIGNDIKCKKASAQF